MQKPAKSKFFDKTKIYPHKVSTAESSAESSAEPNAEPSTESGENCVSCIVLEEDDPCVKKPDDEPRTVTYFTPGLDPR